MDKLNTLFTLKHSLQAVAQEHRYNSLHETLKAKNVFTKIVLDKLLNFFKLCIIINR